MKGKAALEDFLDSNKVRENACAHLARFPATSAQLRSVLLRRFFRLKSDEDTETQQRVRQTIDEVIEDLKQTPYLDDARIAIARAESLLQRGASWSEIRGKLSRAGLDREQIQQAVETLQAQDEQAEWHALVRYARRRRLGPFRVGRPENKARETARLMRKGFRYETVRRLLAEETPETLSE